jgi:hypothetical protein
MPVIFDSVRPCDVKGEIAAVDIAFHVVKAKSFEHRPKLLHFDHRAAADVDAAEQC